MADGDKKALVYSGFVALEKRIEKLGISLMDLPGFAYRAFLAECKKMEKEAEEKRQAIPPRINS